MSHFTHIETQIKDITALKAACAELGLEVLQNAEARGYGNNRIQGDYVIKLRGPYDVALQKTTGGPYRLTADLWADHVEKELGKDFGTLKQLYGVHKASLEASKKGLTIRRQDQQNGSIRLTLCRV
jgi:hypothetical protein